MPTTTGLFPEIEKFALSLAPDSLPDGRKEILEPLIDYIRAKVRDNGEIRLNFICTHNSRRSHLAQIWAQTAAASYGIHNVFCYSGGTEATSLYPMIAQTLTDTGFAIQMLADGNNPVYAIKYSPEQHPVIGFSKAYYDDFNPESGFAAIMTCSQADGGCPFVSGAEKRIPIMYEDPKAFDNTPQQAEKYRERSRQIAAEMFYVFSKVKN